MASQSPKKIFLSSTAEDLKQHRERVTAAIERLGQTASRMEVFGARPEMPLQECRNLAAESDALVVIVAHRYGWIPTVEKGGDDKKSITWHEVDAALEQEKPVFAFLVNEQAPWEFGKEQDGLTNVETEAEIVSVGKSVRLLNEFKQFLSNRIRDTFTTPADLAEKVSTSLIRWLMESQPADADSEPTTPDDAPVVPKGLRSFDENDADFFLHLVPGPRDKDGLPESIRFWKHRIEYGSDEVPIGLIWGPSGCGKTSLVRAGVLPNLAEHVVPIYLEATADDTEQQLLSRVRRCCPDLSVDAKLADALRELRGRTDTRGKHFVIILDQFEQWLHGRPINSQTELVQALRHCDGRHLQCIVMIRDDFWTAVKRFMKEMCVDIRDGHSSAFVDLFDKTHARNVLASFGRAFQKPVDDDEDAQHFATRAIDQLSDNYGKVVAVRLALFAEMVKSHPWKPKTLDTLGGVAGIGVAFLEESLGPRTRYPILPRHAEAAKSILKSLNPDLGTDIKGSRKSRQQLLEAANYSRRVDDFDQVLSCLDRDVRLIRGTEDGEQESAGAETQKYYQLTHDYLVGSIREWVSQKQEETHRGRAELRLEKRARAWSEQPENRHLPALWEVINIWLFTRVRHWTETQRTMMRRALRWHGVRVSVWSAVILMTVSIPIWIIGSLRAETAVKDVVAARTDSLNDAVSRITWFQRWAISRLRNELANQAGNDTILEREESAQTKANVAAALIAMNQVEAARPVLRSSKDPTSRSYLVDRLHHVSSVRQLLTALDREQDDSIRHALILALGKLPIPEDGQDELLPKLFTLFQEDPDPGIHSATFWLLTSWSQSEQLGKILKSLKETEEQLHDPNRPQRRWYVNSQLQTLVLMQDGEFVMGSPPVEPGHDESEQQHRRVIPRPFAICATEVTVEQFLRFKSDHVHDSNYSPETACPVNSVKWYEAVAYCNWLSGQEGVEPDQWCYETNDAGVFDARMKMKPDYLQLTGYRLPTEAEWEYACRAGTETAYYFGGFEELLVNYGCYRQNSGGRTFPVGQLMPNDLGLFDTHRNVWEWCQSAYVPAADGTGDVAGEVSNNDSRVLRGGAFDSAAVYARSAFRVNDQPGSRDYNLGFRLARTYP